MPVRTASPVKSAAAPWFPQARGARTETIAPTAFQACMLMRNRVTALRIAAAIIHRCRRCGALSSNRVAADDNPMKLMSIAMKPLCEPPFPLERIEEMTALMGGAGELPNLK